VLPVSAHIAEIKSTWYGRRPRRCQVNVVLIRLAACCGVSFLRFTRLACTALAYQHRYHGRMSYSAKLLSLIQVTTVS
jgi:hypothetical protein